MKCSFCGSKLEEGQTRCPSCGTAVEQGGDAARENRELTRSEFYRDEASKKVRGGIKSSAIIIYVCTALSALLAIFLLNNPLYLIDAALVLALGLGIQFKQSRVCAVLMLAYTLLSCVIALINTGQASGWLMILAAVYAVKGTFALEKEYQDFKAGQDREARP